MNFNAIPKWADKAQDFDFVQAYSWVKQKAVRYSIVVESVKLLAINTLLLTSLAIPSIPTIASRSIIGLLAYTGVESLPYWVDLFLKLKSDCEFAYKNDMKWLAFITGVKALVTLSNIGLTIGGFVAAIAGITGSLDLQKKMYKYMFPWATITLAASFVLLFAYVYLTREALKELKGCDELKFTPLLRAALDKDTAREAEEMINAMTAEERVKLKKTLEENLETQLKFAQGADLVLQIIGYGIMAVQKFYTPTSLVTAITNEIYSAGWTFKLFIATTLEVLQRKKMNQVFKECKEEREEASPQAEFRDYFKQNPHFAEHLRKVFAI